MFAWIGGAHCLVRFLRVFGLGFVRASLNVLLSEFIASRGDECGLRIRSEIHTVGTHVGNVSRFVQFLSDAHRARGRESEPRGGDLLERRGRKRAARRSRDFRFLYRLYAPLLTLGFFQDALRLRFGLGLFRTDDGKLFVLFGLYIGAHDPIFFRNECADFALAFHDDAQGGGLHAASGETVAYFFPNQSGEIVAEEAIEHPARFLRFYQFFINLARMRERFLHGLFRNFVKYDALGFFELDRFREVPCDRFSLAIGVGGENHFCRFFRFCLQVINHMLLQGDDLVLGFETVFNVHSILIALGQIANVAHRRTDGEPLAEVFFDCFRLCGRLNYYQFHAIYR